MSGRSGIWSRLEIEPTSDTRKIKRAYAKQAAKYHPEDFPEEFQQIRQAYEAALQMAKSESSVQDEFVMADFTGGAVKEEVPETNHIVQEEDSGHIWQEAERIGTLTEKYAKEEKRENIRRALYDAFLVEIALDKLDSFLKMSGLQSHKAWCSYLQEPVFLEAVHNPYFLFRLTDRIGTLNFQKRTRMQIREVLEKEVPDELAVQKRLKLVLNGQKLLNEEDRRKQRDKKIGLIIFVCISIFATAYGFREDTKQSRINEVRAPEKIEEYIEEKYQISCTVSESHASAFRGNVLQPVEDKDTEYFLAETDGERGVPESFHLSWAVSSMEYDDILDDLEYETVSMCAKECGLILKLSSLGNANVIQLQDVPLEEFSPLFLEFLQALKDSRFVQSGNVVEIEVQAGIADYVKADFTVSKESSISEDEVRAKLEEYADQSVIYNSVRQ